MVVQLSFAGFEIFAAALAVLVVSPAIRFVAIESEMMRYIKDPSPRFEPLLELMRLRARYLLKAMLGLVASFLVLFLLFAGLPLADGTPLTTALGIFSVGLAGYAGIQMLLEIRLTLIGFTFQEANKSEKQ